MYKVLLIDDERYIRKSIRNRVNWERLGLSVEAEASNGAEALEMLDTIRPQIVLVDIRMPLMDGLAFIEEAKKRYPDIRCIITSAYSDFEYAKQAIRLGVEDYILKPVNVAEVEKLLEKLVHEIDEIQIARQLQNRAGIRDSGLKMKGSKIVAIAFYIKESDGEEKIICNCLREYLEEKARLEIYYLREYSCGECHVCLINGNILDQELIRGAVEAVWKRMEDREGAAAWSEEMPDAEIFRAAERSVRILKRKIFYPEKKILSERHTAAKSETEKQAAGVQQNKIREAMNYTYQYQIKNNLAMMENELMQLPKLIVNRNNTIPTIEAAISELVVLLRRIMGNVADDTESNILFRGFIGKDYLLRYNSEEELRSALHEMIGIVLKRYGQREEMGTIDQIKAYIRSNYAGDLNATDIANQFFLNSSYLSAMFKEKTGMNMSTYIEAVRMERAKQLLESGKLSVTEVAMHTGYAESNYFSKVFRKYTGMSPRQYREAEAKEQ